MTIKKFDSTGQATVNKTILDTLTAVLKKHGVRVKSNTPGVYTDDTYLVTLELVLMDEAAPGVPETPEARVFKQYARNYGLKPEDLGRTFFSNGVQYRITGLVTSRPKNPIKAVRVNDDRGFKFPANVVSAALRSATPAAPSAPASVFADIETPVVRPEIEGAW